MAENYGAKRAAIQEKSHISRVARLLLLAVGLLVLQSGCQDEASTVRGPETQQEPEKIAVSTELAKPEESGQESASTAEQTVQAPVLPVVKAPKITLEKVVHDFGQIGPGTAQTAQFKLTNEGTASLKITQVRVCCGVVARGVKAGQEYGPGQSGVLELDYRAGMQPGSMRRKIYIQSNDPLQGVVTLTIQATIVRRVDHTPTSLKLFLKQENAGAKDITLTSLDGKPFSIKGFRATANAITAEFDPATKATKFVLKPKANMEKLPKNLRGQISIDLTHPECKNVRILYDVLAEFTVSPPQIMLFNLKAGQPMQRELWILSNYQEDFEIESVSSQKGTVKLIDKKKVEKRYQLRIELTPPPVEGNRAVLSDVLEVKIKGGETLSIQCRGFYQGE